jgi:hypothetical protein
VSTIKILSWIEVRAKSLHLFSTSAIQIKLHLKCSKESAWIPSDDLVKYSSVTVPCWGHRGPGPSFHKHCNRFCQQTSHI